MEFKQNVKSLFAIGRALPAEVGLPQAMALLGLKLEGTPPRPRRRLEHRRRAVGSVEEAPRVMRTTTSRPE
jgi:hypothetical protein